MGYFKKYPSLMNHYSQKEMSYWLTINPGLAQATYDIREKVDGANISFYISDDDTPIIACSRNRVLPPEENFFGLPAVREQYENEFKVLKDYAKSYGHVLRVYGEFFGKKIIERVDYGKGKRILFFDVKINNSWLTPEEFEAFFFDDVGLDHMVVPQLALVRTLEEALEFPVETDSVLGEINDGTNHMEGVVIRPYKLVQESPQGSIFKIKKKGEKFKEKEHRKKAPAKIDGKLLEYQAEFQSYLTESRLIGIFSKFGEIWKPSQIGEYIKYMMDDAMEDFLKDNPEFAELSKKEKKTVFSVGGKHIAPMLKEKLNAI